MPPIAVASPFAPLLLAVIISAYHCRELVWTLHCPCHGGSVIVWWCQWAASRCVFDGMTLFAPCLCRLPHVQETLSKDPWVRFRPYQILFICHQLSKILIVDQPCWPFKFFWHCSPFVSGRPLGPRPDVAVSAGPLPSRWQSTGPR